MLLHQPQKTVYTVHTAQGHSTLLVPCRLLYAHGIKFTFQHEGGRWHFGTAKQFTAPKTVAAIQFCVLRLLIFCVPFVTLASVVYFGLVPDAPAFSIKNGNYKLVQPSLEALGLHFFWHAFQHFITAALAEAQPVLLDCFKVKPPAGEVLHGLLVFQQSLVCPVCRFRQIWIFPAFNFGSSFLVFGRFRHGFGMVLLSVGGLFHL